MTIPIVTIPYANCDCKNSVDEYKKKILSRKEVHRANVTCHKAKLIKEQGGERKSLATAEEIDDCLVLQKLVCAFLFNLF